MSDYYITPQVKAMWTVNLKEGPIEITHDGEIQAWVMGSKEAFMYIQDHQGQSIPWACAYEGWAVRSAFQQPIIKARQHFIFQETQIIYVPSHLDSPEKIADLNNWYYPNGIQQGFVTTHSGNRVYCRYWNYKDIYKPGLVLPPELRTKGNSEMCDIDRLYLFQTFAPGVVSQAMKEIGEQQ